MGFALVEVSERNVALAIYVYQKPGFRDSGYTDPDRPQYLNLIFPFEMH